MNELDHIRELATRYISGQATAAEKTELHQWYDQHAGDDKDEIVNGQGSAADVSKRIYKRIHSYIHTDKKKQFHWYYTTAAAIFIVTLATALYFYRSTSIVNRPSKVVNEVGPGKNRAILTLADGTKVNLDSAKSGIQINDENINYNDGTKIIAPIHHSSAGSRTQSFITYNSLTTPKGGQYQIILEDGTKVWLNAASTLTYPARFSGDRREVSLEGEAYFMVAKSQKTGNPFIVKSRNQETMVMGTEFNLSAYADESSIKTTLINGSVRVSHKSPVGSPTAAAYVSLQLVPNEQSTLTGIQLTKAKADVSKAIAWKKGQFRFTGETLGEAMQQIGRWYDVDVVFADGGLRQAPVSGIINRSERLSVLLNLFERVGDVHFEFRDRTLIIKK
ncbi:FecR family protein [bacterium A37T11]|nr:FecR family protein [bacterium A37T11]